MKPLKGSFHYKEDVTDLAKLCYDAARRQVKLERRQAKRDAVKAWAVRTVAKIAFPRKKES